MKTSVLEKSKIIIFTLIIIFLSTIKVEASTCTGAQKNKLVKEAKNIEIIPYFDDEYNPMHEYFYNVNITNFSKNVYIVDSNNNRFEYEGSYDSDSVFGMYKPGSRITFKIYGAYDSECSEQLLVTLKVDFEYYNDYSTFEECTGIEDFYLCKRNYSGKIESKEWFLEQIDKYKKGEIENVDPDQKEEKQNFFYEFFNNKIVQFVTVIIILIIVYFLSRSYVNSKKRIKIKIPKKRKWGVKYGEEK